MNTQRENFTAVTIVMALAVVLAAVVLPQLISQVL